MEQHKTDKPTWSAWVWLALLAIALLLLMLGPPRADEDQFCYEYSSEGKLCFPDFRGYKITEDSKEDVTESVVKIIWYPNYEEVTQAWATLSSQRLPRVTIEAWSWSDYSEELGLWVCEIHAVKPEMVIGDARMDALGHELYHCFVGDFYET